MGSPTRVILAVRQDFCTPGAELDQGLLLHQLLQGHLHPPDFETSEKQRFWAEERNEPFRHKGGSGEESKAEKSEGMKSWSSAVQLRSGKQLDSTWWLRDASALGELLKI